VVQWRDTGNGLPTRSTQGGTFMSNRTTPTMQPSQAGKPAVPHEQIAKRAYEKWCKRGCTDGMHQEDWLEGGAERRLEMRGQATGKPAQVPPPAVPASRPQPAAPAMAQKAAPRR